MNALEIRGLKKNYKGFSLDIDELTLPCGCVMGLVGENGAGKTTTLKLALGMLRADSGSVSIFGRSGRERIPKEEIGAVLGEPGIPGLTAAQTGKVMARIYQSWDDRAYESCLRRLNVPADKAFDKLSQGMRMKLGIAVAVSHHARLLLLDEAANGLDPVARDEVTEMLWEFSRDEQNAVLVSTHIVSDLERICDYVAFMHRGRIMLCQEKDALTARYGLLRCPAARLDELDRDAVLFRRDAAYGAEAIVDRSGVPAGTPLEPVGVEDIFVAMAREDEV